MQRCGVEVDRERLGFAFDFLARGTGTNGYLWYADGVAGDEDWADMGRTGASAIALALDPWPNDAREDLRMRQTLILGEHPESFPDTHGSPIMGMGYGALAANQHAPSFRRLMDANRWWFTLSECHDGTFYYQPNRDNAGYGADSRLSASAVTAFILSIEKQNLLVTRAKAAR
jgi:glycosidase